MRTQPRQVNIKARSRTAPTVNAPESGIKIVQRKIEELVFADYNPRDMTDQEEADLVASVQKFNMVEPAIINMHPDRLNHVVGGHQRLKVLKKLGYVMAPCVEVSLELKDERELNLRLNKNQGHWDTNMLKEHFSRDELKQVGFLDSELAMILRGEEEKTKEALAEPEVTYPIVARVDEGYDSVTVFCTSKIDMLWLKETLGITTHRSYKCEAVAENRAISCKQFQEKLNEYVRLHAHEQIQEERRENVQRNRQSTRNRSAS